MAYNGANRLALLDAAYGCRREGDAQKAIALEQEAAGAGSDDALWTLALRYRHGIGVEADARKAYSCLCRMKRAAGYVEREKAACLALMGKTELALDFYYAEWRLHGDAYAAAEFFRLLAGAGNRVDFAPYLAELMEDCCADAAYMAAADTLIADGFSEGYFLKALIFYNSGWMSEERVREALRLLAASAEMRFAPARGLACEVAADSGLPVEEIRAVLQAAADNGASEGFYGLAQLCGREGDSARASALMRQAAEAGHAAALLGELLEMKKAGVPNVNAYFQACKRGAESNTRGCEEEHALLWYLLGEAYAYGIGVQRDAEQAEEWYAKCCGQPYYLIQAFTRLPRDKHTLQRVCLFAKHFLLYDSGTYTAFLSRLKALNERMWRKSDGEYRRFRRGKTLLDVDAACGNHLSPGQKHRLLKRAARLGNGDACAKLAGACGRESARVRYLQRGVRLNSAKCMFDLGYLLLNRKNSESWAKGVAWTLRSYHRCKSLAALQNLGLQYQKGRGVPQNAEKALECYKQTFEECRSDDSADAKRIRIACATSVYLAYLTGSGAPQDVRQAVLWLRRAAEMGDETAMYNLGAVCFDDTYGREDEALCKLWYSEADAHGYESKDGDLYLDLGYFYHYGTDANERDFDRAEEYYRRAAEFEDSAAAAYSNLGALYSQELNDHASAIEWYRKSLNCKPRLSVMNSLAVCYAEAETPDLDAAEALYKRIVEEAPPHSYTIGFALVNLAWNADDPRRKERDREKAQAYAARALEALTETVCLHERGEDVEWSDYVYPNLAELYFDGKWCARNLKKAEEYAVKGAKLGRRSAVRLCEKHGWAY